jgi:hypothetical protein
MEGVNHTMGMLVFHGVVTKYPKHHLFVYEAIWTVKKVQYDDAKIV